MSHANFHIVYDGPALAGNEMDVRELAPALLALGEVLEQANATINQDKAKIALRVKASFRTGCFGIDFSVVQSLVDQVVNMFNAKPVESAGSLLSLLGFTVPGSAYGLVKLVKWLQNRPIKEVILLDDGRAKVVIDGDCFETEQRTIELLRNYMLRRALEQAIAKPLELPGIDTVALTDDERETNFVVIEKHERDYFAAPQEDEEQLVDDVSEAALKLVSVSFKGDNKWRFSTGEAPFYSTISDTEFLNRVNLGMESFRAGDILIVKLRKKQYRFGESIRSEYDVEKVVEHITGPNQLKLPLRRAKEMDE
ncbi:MAG: hypothetical protein ACOX5Z_11870 [Desulfobulbus sp.]|jgi:hypothetical protein